MQYIYIRCIHSTADKTYLFVSGKKKKRKYKAAALLLGKLLRLPELKIRRRKKQILYISGLV